MKTYQKFLFSFIIAFQYLLVEKIKKEGQTLVPFEMQLCMAPTLLFLFPFIFIGAANSAQLSKSPPPLFISLEALLAGGTFVNRTTGRE